MKQKLLNITYRFLKICAKKYVKKHKPEIIGITGSVGKTSGRMIITQVLRQLGSDKIISTSPKNFNSELGIIFSIFEITQYDPNIKSLGKNILSILKKLFLGEKPYDILFLEYGIDQPGDMSYLTSIVPADYAIFTKLDFVHVQYFSKKEDIGEEKKILLDTAKKKIYIGNSDDYLESIYDSYEIEKQFFPLLQDVEFSLIDNKIQSQFMFEGKMIHTNIFGEENLEYIILGLQLGKDLGMNLKKDNYNFYIENQPGRFSIYAGIKNSVCIDSTYNAAPASMVKMIENTFMLQKSLYPEYKVFLVLGDMRELGEISPSKHLELNDSVINADGIYLIGEEMQPLYQAIEVQNFEGEYKIFKKSIDAGNELKKYLEKSDEKYIILFKGSQNTIFTEEALKEVLQNNEDKKLLVRQSDDWMKKKKQFFNK